MPAIHDTQSSDFAPFEPARVAPVEPDATRAATLARVRVEVRGENARLTERQIDLIADATVELRMAYSRLGLLPRRRLSPE
jgi:hypothetical protein